MLRNHPYITSAQFWPFSDLTHYVSKNAVLKVIKTSYLLYQPTQSFADVIYGWSLIPYLCANSHTNVRLLENRFSKLHNLMQGDCKS